MTFMERLDALCLEHKISKRTLEKEAGLSTGITSKWKDKLPGQPSLVKISRYFNVSVDYLTGESEYKTKTEEMLQHIDDITDLPELRNQIREARLGDKQIPVLGEVAAGVPIFASENYIDYEVISNEMAKSGSCFGLKIKGDSMSPRIMEGDTVIVRQQDDAESGDIVIVLVNGDSATCKRLMKYQEGISLISFNPAYEPMTFTNKEILDKPVKIIGKVIENRQKY